jgi:hypothetical protein
MLHELVHQHERGLLGSMEPANQLVAYIWKSGEGLKVILDTLVEVCLCTICIGWTLLRNDAGCQSLPLYDLHHLGIALQ